jgi:arabinogalactan oligomer / maltooligosaccharide transport system permease protein
VKLAACWLIGLVVGLLGWASAARADDVVEVAEARPELVLWHAYRAEEASTIEVIVDELNRTRADFRVKVLAVPYDAYLDKIGAAIPRGRGPDVFIAAHDPIGDWAKAQTVQPLDDVLDPQTTSQLLPGLLDAVLFEGHVYGLPIAFKSIALWRNTDLVKEAPTTWSELLAVATANTGAGRYGLVYENRDLYFHAPLLFGSGGVLFDDDGRPGLTAPGTIRSVVRAQQVKDSGVVPAEVSGTLTMSLWNAGKAAMIITGPWSRGEVEPGVRFAVSPLPTIDDNGTSRPMRPFLTVEAVFVSGQTSKRALAVTLARLLGDHERSVVRLHKARQPVALASAWETLGDDDDARFLRGFRAQLGSSVPTPNTPAMKSVWGPFNLALGETLGQGTPAKDTLAAAQATLDGVLAEVERPSTPRGQGAFAVVVVVVMALLIGWMVLSIRRAGGAAKIARDVVEQRVAYLYAAPAMIGTAALVLVPFVVGIGMGFYRHAWGRYTFVGLENFETILTDTDAAFFRTLGVTVLWTACNVALHVAIGVVLALILSQARLRFRGLYRVIFIIPWAMPSYITALVWKGMFHPEFGAINALLGTPGFSWMNQFWSAFLANLITNTWLGFPFMMVTALGGLTAIPKDLYEAAALDGAGPWKRFTSITLPLLRPTLAPAIVLGTVWTFNMFNVIYLVSGGAPGGRTDILITEAFRWAFERGQGGAFGTAAAYSTLIFLMLLAYDTASKRVLAAIKGAS